MACVMNLSPPKPGDSADPDLANHITCLLYIILQDSKNTKILMRWLLHFTAKLQRDTVEIQLDIGRSTAF